MVTNKITVSRLNRLFNLPQFNVNLNINQSQDQTFYRDTIGENLLEPAYRGGIVAARKQELFIESMNIDEWIDSLKAKNK